MDEHIGIWGRTQSGKTTRAKLILAGRIRKVVFDPLDEYQQVAPLRASSLSSVLGYMRAGWAGDFGIRYVPESRVDQAAALDRLAVMLMDVQEPYRAGLDQRSITLAVDEMALAAPNVRKLSKGFSALCVRGRHWGISLIGTSQRMAEVSTTFRGNTQIDYFYPLRAAVDRDTALKLISPEHRAALAALKPHDCLVFEGGAVRKDRNPPI